MNARAVLILSTEPLAAALVGAAVEVSGCDPVFPLERETPRDALRRLRPGIVLIDASYDAARSESFLGPVLMTGARVVMFASSQAQERSLESVAKEFRVRVVRMPLTIDELTEILRGGTN